MDLSNYWRWHAGCSRGTMICVDTSTHTHTHTHTHTIHDAYLPGYWRLHPSLAPPPRRGPAASQTCPDSPVSVTTGSHSAACWATWSLRRRTRIRTRQTHTHTHTNTHIRIHAHTYTYTQTEGQTVPSLSLLPGYIAAPLLHAKSIRARPFPTIPLLSQRPNETDQYSEDILAYLLKRQFKQPNLPAPILTWRDRQRGR